MKNAETHEMMINRYRDSLDQFAWHGQHIPGYMHDGLVFWIVDGTFPGGFLTAVLEGDLHQAVNQGDDINRKNLVAYSIWLFNYAPADCYHSHDRMHRWHEAGGLWGRVNAVKEETQGV